jgi:hypothetical protein
MKLCLGCNRHVPPSLAACPFCATALPTTGNLAQRLCVGLGLAVASCGPSAGGVDEGSEGTDGPASSSGVPSDSSGAVPGTSGATMSMTTAVDSTTGMATTTDGTTTGSDDDTDDGPVGFYGGFEFDTPITTLECDVAAQDCVVGEKCVPFASDGGPVWNGTRCVPMVPNPNQLGEPCQVEGGPVSGIDDCDAGLQCFGVDGNNEGECVSLCWTYIGAPPCELPGTECAAYADAMFGACLSACDPLDPVGCGTPDACLPLANEGAHCVPHTDAPYGSYGDECLYLTDCAPGHVCVLAEHVPGCTGDGCCTTYCDPAEGDAQCPDVGLGQTCTAILPDAGACMVP